MFYYIITNGTEQFVVSFRGMFQQQIQSMLPLTYPGSTFQIIDKTMYDAFVAEHSSH